MVGETLGKTTGNSYKTPITGCRAGAAPELRLVYQSQEWQKPELRSDITASHDVTALGTGVVHYSFGSTQLRLWACAFCIIWFFQDTTYHLWSLNLNQVLEGISEEPVLYNEAMVPKRSWTGQGIHNHSHTSTHQVYSVLHVAQNIGTGSRKTVMSYSTGPKLPIKKLSPKCMKFGPDATLN